MALLEGSGDETIVNGEALTVVILGNDRQGIELGGITNRIKAAVNAGVWLTLNSGDYPDD